MNFTINKDLLLQNLNDVSRAISTKIQMPGLTGILFKVTKSLIVLTTSNNEISIQATIDKDFNVIEEGSFVVQGRLLIEIIKRLTSKEVDFIDFEENTIKILAGKSNFTINCLQLDSFPNINFDKAQLNFSIDAINMRQLIRKTVFAISNSESRVVLTGISINISNNDLEVIATDSYRLARKKIIFDKQFEDIKIIVPGKSMDELSRIIDDSEENITIYCSSTQILFEYRNLLFQSRLINGVFPKIDSLIPQQYLNQIKFNKEELISTIDRVAIFVNNEASSIIKLTITSDNVVEFDSNSTDIGAAKEELVPLSFKTSGPFQISFSSKYFLEAIKSFDDDEIYLNFVGEIKPFTITSEKDKNLIQLILPVRS